MVSLRLLGGASLEAPDGPVGGPASQRHRLALLAVLAVAAPRGVPRDKLIGCLWPERDSRHGRNLLKQAVHVLRRLLGDNAITSTGDDLRLDVTVVHCDVAELGMALARGDLQAAVELYAGPFLDGFHLPDAAEFERWLDGERERLRQAYRDALTQLADEATQNGDARSAAGWWRRLAAEDPYNAQVTIRLMEALAAAGDRTAAIRHAQTHAALLQQEFDTEPEPVVVALAERLREEPVLSTLRPSSNGSVSDRSSGDAAAASDDAVARGDVSGTVTAYASATASAPFDSTGPSARRSRRSVRGAALGVLALGGAAALLSPPWFGDWSRADLLDNRVVVEPFENRTADPSLDQVGNMAADWITQALSHSDKVDVVSASAAIAEETDAGIVISGAYYHSGDSLYMHARIRDARGSKVLRVIGPVAATIESPAVAVDLLKTQLLGALAPWLEGDGVQSVPVENAPSYEAYRAFADGRQSFMNGRMRDAIGHLTRASELDPDYLAPKLLATFAYGNAGEMAASDSLFDELQRVRERLTPHDRALLDFGAATADTDPVARYHAARRLAMLAPGSLPHVEWATGALRLGRPREALRILSELEPPRREVRGWLRGEIRGWPRYWVTTTDALHLLGEHERELSEAQHARTLDPDFPTYHFLEARALVALGRVAEAEEVASRLQMLPDPRRTGTASQGERLRMVADELRVHGHLQAASRVYDRALQWFSTRTNALSESEEFLRVSVLQNAGRYAEAADALRPLLAAWPDRRGYRSFSGVLAAIRGDQREAGEVDQWLAGIAERDPQAPSWRACIAVAQGRFEDAISLLREGFARGAVHGMPLHTRYCVDPLRGYQPFIELIEPLG